MPALAVKEQAIAEGVQAVELMPLSRDAYDGMLVLQGLAQVYTWTGESDQALGLRAPADEDAGLFDLRISEG